MEKCSKIRIWSVGVRRRLVIHVSVFSLCLFSAIYSNNRFTVLDTEEPDP